MRSLSKKRKIITSQATGADSGIFLRKRLTIYFAMGAVTLYTAAIHDTAAIHVFCWILEQYERQILNFIY